MAPPNKRSVQGKKTDDIDEDEEVQETSTDGEYPSNEVVRSKTLETAQKKRKRKKVTGDSDISDDSDIDSKRNKTAPNEDDRDGSYTKTDNELIDYRSAIAASAATVVAASTVSVAVAQQPVRTVPTVNRLRMPSQHTPGKTTASKNIASLPPRLSQPLEQTANNLDDPAATEKRVGLILNTPHAVSKRPLAPVRKQKDQVKLSDDQQAVEDDADEKAVATDFHSTFNRFSSRALELWDKTREHGRIIIACAQDKTLALQYWDATREHVSFMTRHSSIVENAQQLWKNISDPEQEDSNESVTVKRLSQPNIWFWLLIIPQILFFNLFLSGAVQSSNLARSLYQSFLFVKGPPTTKSSLNYTQIRHDIATVGILLDVLSNAQTSLQSKKQELGTELEADQLVLQVFSLESKHKLQDMIDRMQETVVDLNQFLAQDNVSFQDPILNSIRANLGTEETNLVDFSELELWDISDYSGGEKSSSCTDLNLNMANTTNAITEVQVAAALEELTDNLRLKTSLAKNDPEILNAVQAWIRAVVIEAIKESQADTTDSSNEEKRATDSTVQVRKYISARLEIETADQTGLIDFASIANGATVIKTGPFATSPSLVDQLPFVNRLAHSMLLRFYGYRAEAALSPTHPKSALGQCWAFGKHTTSLSSFGSLSVRLAKPIIVESVSVEHPPAERSDRVDTAIRSFRIVGHTDMSDESETYQLGSFEYQIGGSSTELQIFEIERKFPTLSMISLHVDTNWGGPYACLYRFRVHGFEEEKVDSD